MKTYTQPSHINRSQRIERAQSMVEFALILPLLLFIIFGLIEFGHLLATYSMLTSASRDAARYAAAAGDVGGGVPHYLDCAGIRAAARQNAILVDIPDSNILISYDSGPGTPKISTTCPATVPVDLGMRVVVELTANYEPIVGVAGLIDPFRLTSTTVRTILTSVEVEGTPAAGTGGTPQVFFSTDAGTISENGGNFTLQVRLTAANSGETYVPFSVSGSAAYCDDFSVSANSLENVCEGPVTGTFHIPAGQTSANVVIAISNDSMDEYDETVVLSLAAASNATLGSPSVFALTITDDDNPPTVRFASSNQGGNEDVGGLVASVILNAVSGKEVVVPYSVTDSENSAKVNLDYTLDGTSVTIPAGSLSASIGIGIVNDTLDEVDETFTLHMGTPTNADRISPYDQVFTIIDNDQPPVVKFDTDAQRVGESIATVNVTISLTAASSRNVTVPFSVGGTATLTADYSLNPANNTITIPAGSTSANIVVTLVNDGISELDETVIFTMGNVNPIEATKGTPSVHTLTILGVTTQPEVSFQSETGTAQAEGLSSIPVRITLSNVWTQNVTVNVAINAASTATQNKDYTVATTSVTIPAGETYVDYVITLIDDPLDETDIETVILNLNNPVNATLGTKTQHTAKIQDNDAMPVVSIRVNTSFNPSNPESTTGIVVDVTLSHGSGNTVTVPFTVGGTATRGASCQNPAQGVDYCLSNASPITIAPESTRAQLTLTIVDDSVYGEPNETIVLTLAGDGITNAILGLTDTSTTYTINENDLCPSLSPMPNPNGSKLDLTISNPSNVTVLLTSVSIYWLDNPSNQSLSKVYLGVNKIWQTGASNSPATISSGWPNNENFRQIASGSSAVLSFQFSVSPLQTSSSDYVSVTFSNGCTISVRRSN